MTQGIKQENMRDCVAAVAAMATETTLAQVKAEIDEHPDGGYSDIDFIAYCARHGVVAGGWCWNLEEVEATKLIKQGLIGVHLDHPAYVGVRSERLAGKGHAVFWDGKQVWDPNPKAEDGRPLTDYAIECWWPLCRSSDNAKYLADKL